MSWSLKWVISAIPKTRGLFDWMCLKLGFILSKGELDGWEGEFFIIPTTGRAVSSKSNFLSLYRGLIWSTTTDWVGQWLWLGQVYEGNAVVARRWFKSSLGSLGEKEQDGARSNRKSEGPQDDRNTIRSRKQEGNEESRWTAGKECRSANPFWNPLKGNDLPGHVIKGYCK